MFKIQGSDQKEYGPVSAEVLRQWIVERRADGRTLLQAEGSSGWKPLAEFPEFAAALAMGPRFPVPGAAPAPPQAPAGVAKTSGMAIASLVCGILGFLCVPGLVGLVLGIIALVKINNSAGRLKGSGLAIAGICLSALMLLFIVPVGMLLPALARAKQKAQTINCMSNMKQLAYGARLYANENKDSLPPSDSWCDAVQGQINNPRVFVCHSSSGIHRCTYAMNKKVAGRKIGEVHPQTVLFFEIQDGWNVSGGPELLDRSRHRIVVVTFVDGSAMQISIPELNSLRWDP